MTQLLGLVYDVPKLDKDNVEKFINLLIESSKKITSMLFKDKAEEFAQYAEDLSLDEVGSVLQMLGLIELVSDSENYSKLIKTLKKWKAELIKLTFRCNLFMIFFYFTQANCLIF